MVLADSKYPISTCWGFMQSIRVLTVDDIRKEMQRINVDPFGLRLMADKASFFVVKIENIDHRVANILKQEMLSLGAEAACSREVMSLKRGRAPVLLLGTKAQFEKLFHKLSLQPFGLKDLAARIKEVLQHIAVVGKRPLVMGILNVTPDSFSDGGEYLAPESAYVRALEMVREGADIIDVGGESSRPGSRPVPVKVELERILPVIKRLVKNIKIPLSVDTYKSEVAEVCLDQGVAIVNDISALHADRRMAGIVARFQAAVVLMHRQGTSRNMQKNPQYRDVVGQIFSFLEQRICYAVAHDIKKENIIIDPGIGFGKTLEHNLEILNKIPEFKSLGYKVMIGASRKSMIGKILKTEPDQRLFGGLGVAAWADMHGVDILRVHDVKETKEIVTVLSAIKNLKKR